MDAVATLDLSIQNTMQEPLIPSIVKKDSPGYIPVKEIKEILLHANTEAGRTVRNIALTGPFGSGKSSILLTVQKEIEEEWKVEEEKLREGKGKKYDLPKEKNLIFLPISLATLKSPKDSKDDKSTKESDAAKESSNDSRNDEKKDNKQSIEELNRRIEYSILQQLVYRENATKVPDSRIKRIHSPHTPSYSNLFWIILGAVVAFFVLFEPSWLRVETIYNALNFGKFNIIGDVLSAIYLIWLGYKYFIPGVAKAYNKYKVDKINLHGAEIKIEQENSIFNHHLDEILYFFSQTDYNVVLIEDLDRFGSPDIFLKLRELCMLINESQIVGRHVSFVYAIKDDIFQDEERTKFFDQIVTVIPFINASNSRDKLKEKLDEAGNLGKDIDDDALTDMAFFIQDMRILVNIVNEYAQYHAMLAASNTGHCLDPTKLLGMIVYKNYFPEDFAKLHRREGKVFKALRLRDKFEEIALKEVKDKENKLKLKAKARDEVYGKNVIELRQSLITEVINSERQDIGSFKIGNSFYSPIQIAYSDDLFQKFIRSEEMRYSLFSRMNYGTPIYQETYFTDFDSKVSSALEKTQFNYKCGLLLQENRRLLLQEEWALKRERESIMGQSVSFFLQEYKECQELDGFKKLDLSDMMLRFLKEGYIDENYYDYISYFYEGMLTGSDREWVLSVKMNRPQPYTYALHHINNVSKELKYSDFNNQAVLNVDLLDFLVIHPIVKDKNIYDKFMSLINTSDVDTDFLLAYYDNGKVQEKVLSEYVNWDEETTWHVANETTDSAKADVLRRMWCKYTKSIPDATSEWVNGHFQFISDNYEAIGNGQIEKIVPLCHFDELSFANDELIKLVIENNSYDITFNNISVLLNWINDKPTEHCMEVSMTNILEYGNDQFIEYLIDKENIKQTIECIPENVDESPEGILFILNNDNLAVDIKEEYVKHQSAQIESISRIKEEFQTLAIQYSLVIPTWTNVFEYFSIQTADSMLFEFVRRHHNEISLSDFPKENSELSKLATAFFLSDEFAPNIHDELLSSAKIEFSPSDDAVRLDEDRFKNLLRNKAVRYSEEWIRVLANHDILGDYLEHFSSDFLKTINQYSFALTAKAALILLNSDVFSKQEKVQIFKLLPDSIITSHAGLMDFGATVLIKDYNSLGWDNNQILNLIHPTTDKHQERQLRYMVMTIDEGLIEDMLLALGGIYADILNNSKRPAFPKDEFHEKLLMYLISKGYIKSYHAKDGRYRVYH